MSSGRHLAKGSPTPDVPEDGILRLYSMRFCPFAQRVHLVLDAKQIPYHSIYINLTEKPEWLFEKNPQGKVPALELVREPGPPVLTESLLICEYLDEQYPLRPLYPRDPLKKVQEKLLIERFNAVLGAFFKASDGGDIEPFWNGLDVYERELSRRDTAFFGGEQTGILDYMIWPWCERLELLKLQRGEDYNFDETRFPQLSLWLERMKRDVAVMAFYMEAEVQAEFLRTRSAGKPNYNLLVKDA
ncbi:pyrimidodiazepine synthase [Drosophila sulfurigaster albostrigata]|uniref:pyrimidodiazepine synthase n=1 Tax=Drosophila nasuta TaxID=42062 RepID=UPI00295F3B76|nr:pyrimidodiazepine synthase [Drosophila nasuta]XP_062133917.1 pyrimidodiazepine synthase [Drosophila sulfurigaster albostrigata]